MKTHPVRSPRPTPILAGARPPEGVMTLTESRSPTMRVSRSPEPRYFASAAFEGAPVEWVEPDRKGLC